MSNDMWTPEEVESLVDNLGPDPRGLEGHCSQCGRPTTREYCGSTCERMAAFDKIGSALKFHPEDAE